MTPPPPQPTNHVLANDQPGTINSDQYLDVPFRIDVASAKVSYQVADRSSSSPDNLTTAIVSDAEYRFLQNGQQYKAFGLKMGMAPLSGEAVVPGGGYHFVIVCTNLVQRCQFSFTLAALY